MVKPIQRLQRRRLEMSGKLLIGAAAVLTLGLFSTASTSSPDAAAQSKRAVTVVRLINTAEVYAHRAQARYVSFPELVSSGALNQAAEMNPDFTSVLPDLDLRNASPVRGFDLAVVVSSDGGAYKLSLTPREDCVAAYFSDERGIIYTGKPIGCPAN
jgi:hypothetical protein